MNTGFVFKQRGKGVAGPDNATDQPARCLCFGVFQLDLQEQQLFKDGLKVKVQGKVYQALAALVETPGEIVTRDALRARLWPRDTHLNYEANVNTTVNKLRQVLGDTNEESRFIETIPRKGYSFVAKVEYADRSGLPADGKIPGTSQGKAAIQNLLAEWEFLRSGTARLWFTASLLALTMAAILFGAAVTLYSHRSAQHEVGLPAGQDKHTSHP
jgi:DNA-binding winged helix-turn-helix (wHTH) protein